MIPLLFFLLFLLSVLYFHEWVKNRTINKEILYIKEWIAEISCTKGNGCLLIPSENQKVRELAAQINCLLDSLSSQKADYERSKRAMAQVLTNISHDLRTPLTVLKGYIEWMDKEIRGLSGAERIQDMLEKADGRADELVETIDEYFTMSKITSGDMKVKLQRTNVTEICHEIILDYYDILEKLCFTVEIDTGSAPEYAYVDTDALKRILKNLIDNAVKYGRDGKYLALRIKKVSGRAVIEVEDHGQGIAKKDQEQIFDRTYTTAHKGNGSGLGLTIAKSLARQMEADLLVVSEQGKKTVFSLLLNSRKRKNA